MSFRIGVAGWSIPKIHNDFFSTEGSHLERYAKTFNAVEINSSFYRDHKAVTYRRWAESTPQDFSFSVKLNKIFTHEQKLKVNKDQLAETLNSVKELQSKWGVLLVQIPPSLQFDSEAAQNFFQELRKHYQKEIVFEPRHVSWQNAEEVLNRFSVSKVIADPEPCRILNLEKKSIYFRLHGSPKIYYSNYDDASLKAYAARMNEAQKNAQEVWCIFDNTAEFHATANAIQMNEILSEGLRKRPADQDFFG